MPVGCGGAERGSEMRKQSRVMLSDEQRAALARRLARGAAPTRQLAHARILLKADEGEGGPGWTDAAIARALEVDRSTVGRVRRRFAAEGLAAALAHRAPHVPRVGSLDGADEARLVALACSAPPLGRERWSLRLLAERFVILADDGAARRVSHELVRRALKKTRSSPG